MSKRGQATFVVCILWTGCVGRDPEPRFQPLRAVTTVERLREHGNPTRDLQVQHRLDEQAGVTDEELAARPAQPTVTFAPPTMSTSIRGNGVVVSVRGARVSDSTRREWSHRLDVRSWPGGAEIPGTLRCNDPIEGSGDDMMQCQYELRGEPAEGWYTATLDVSGIEVPADLSREVSRDGDRLVTRFYRGSRPVVREVRVATDDQLLLSLRLSERLALDARWSEFVTVTAGGRALRCEGADTDLAEPADQLLLRCEGAAPRDLAIELDPHLQTIEGVSIANADGSSPARVAFETDALPVSNEGFAMWTATLPERTPLL